MFIWIMLLIGVILGGFVGYIFEGDGEDSVFGAGVGFALSIILIIFIHAAFINNDFITKVDKCSIAATQQEDGNKTYVEASMVNNEKVYNIHIRHKGYSKLYQINCEDVIIKFSSSRPTLIRKQKYFADTFYNKFWGKVNNDVYDKYTLILPVCQEKK